MNKENISITDQILHKEQAEQTQKVDKIKNDIADKEKELKKQEAELEWWTKEKKYLETKYNKVLEAQRKDDQEIAKDEAKLKQEESNLEKLMQDKKKLWDDEQKLNDLFVQYQELITNNPPLCDAEIDEQTKKLEKLNEVKNFDQLFQPPFAETWNDVKEFADKLTIRKKKRFEMISKMKEFMPNQLETLDDKK